METFREICTHVRLHAEPWDLMVITGDLAHDELAETYELLREELGDWLPRIRVLPGNHDNRAGLREVFSEIVPQRSDFLAFAEDLADWRILGLDTHWPGEVAGRIEQDQLACLSEQLASHPASPTVLFMHHPPISVACPWLDEIGLVEPELLVELIKSHPQVQAIFTGHVHQDFRGMLGTVAVLTTPSTAVQFVPHGITSSYENTPPGYRVIELAGDGYQTQVIRMPTLRYPPEPK